MKDSIVAAFDDVCQGFSADRVVADPELNGAFLRECSRVGLKDFPATLNRALLNFRKGGLLRGRKSKRTTFTDQGDYSFAVEMAVRFIERRDGVSLDDVICDPRRAQEFDQLAAKVAPGFSPLQYRWAALSIRKANRLKPELLAKVVRPVDVARYQVDQLSIDAIPPRQGLYLFYARSVALYAGETENLRNRIEKHLEHSDNKGLARWLWEHGAEELHLEIQVLPSETATRIRKALELELIRSRSPLFNVQR
jgi:site-specific DNA-methyltransferase (adenine-specific)